MEGKKKTCPVKRILRDKVWVKTKPKLTVE